MIKNTGNSILKSHNREQKNFAWKCILIPFFVLWFIQLSGQFDPYYSLNINAGGPEITYLGETFLADSLYTNGAKYINTQVALDELYQTERYSSPKTLFYDFPLENGSYKITLHFAEIFIGATGGNMSKGVGDRVFDVSVEGQLMIDNLDIFAEVGAETVFIKTYLIEVNDGELNIYMSSLPEDGGVNYPKISGIQISGISDVDWTSNGSDLIYEGGNVGIGTSTPDAKLSVNGNIHAKEVKVDLIGWPDYVFSSNYKLPTLDEVKNHIHSEGRLINIPSASKIESEGLELGEMQRLLIEKIEELTLYILQQEKEILNQQMQIEALREYLIYCSNQ